MNKIYLGLFSGRNFFSIGIILDMKTIKGAFSSEEHAIKSIKRKLRCQLEIIKIINILQTIVENFRFW